jgi:hypothetical protein
MYNTDKLRRLSVKQKLLLKKYSSLLILAVIALTLVIAVAAFSVKPVSAIVGNTNVQSNDNGNGNSNGNDNANASNDVNTSGGLVHCGNNANDPCTVADFFNLFIAVTNF